jgi:hypothetical protein
LFDILFLLVLIEDLDIGHLEEEFLVLDQRRVFGSAQLLNSVETKTCHGEVGLGLLRFCWWGVLEGIDTFSAFLHFIKLSM